MMDIWGTYFSLLGFGVGVAAAYVALLYIGGKLLGRGEWEKRAKHETIQILLTLLLIPSLFAALDGAFSAVALEADPVGYDSVCGTAPAGGCHFLVAKNTVGELLREELWLISRSLVVNNLLQLVNTFSTDVGDVRHMGGTMMATGHPYKGLAEPQVIELKKVDDWAFRAFNVTAFLYAFFNYLEGALPILFTAGLVLRLFPIARKIGGLLLALAVGLYFIFPLPFLVGGDIYHTITPAEVGEMPGGEPVYMRIAKIDLDTSLAGELGKKWAEGANEAVIAFSTISAEEVVEKKKEWEASVEKYEDEKEGWENIIETVLGMGLGATDYLLQRLAQLWEFVKGLWHLFVGGGSFIVYTYLQMYTNEYFYRYYFEIAASFITFSVITFYVATIATIAFVKQFSPMLGGDVEIGGLTHLV